MNGPLSTNIENFSKFSQLLAASGRNPTNRFLKAEWRENLDYSDFVLAAEKLNDEDLSAKTIFKKKFGDKIDRLAIVKEEFWTQIGPLRTNLAPV